MEQTQRHSSGAMRDSVEVRAARILNDTATFDDRFFGDHVDLRELLSIFRTQGVIIVFATGVWDLFHIGHGDYIQKGKSEAAKLYPDAKRIIMIVGVDTDALTKERKGPSRPVVPQDERCRVLGHLRSVDVITLQYQFNQLYGTIRPDVQIISTSTKDLPPGLELVRDNCTHLVNLPPQAETSTTARVRQLALDGRLEAIKDIRNRLTTFIEEVGRELSN